MYNYNKWSLCYCHFQSIIFDFINYQNLNKTQIFEQITAFNLIDSKEKPNDLYAYPKMDCRASGTTVTLAIVGTHEITKQPWVLISHLGDAKAGLYKVYMCS